MLGGPPRDESTDVLYRHVDGIEAIVLEFQDLRCDTWLTNTARVRVSFDSTDKVRWKEFSEMHRKHRGILALARRWLRL